MRTTLLAVLAVGAAAVGISTPQAAPVRVVQATAARTSGSGEFVPGALPAGFRVVGRVDGPRWGGLGTYRTTTYGQWTKREALASGRTGPGPTFSVTVLRGRGLSAPDGATTRQAGSRRVWVLTAYGATHVGWTDRDGVGVQVVSQRGFATEDLLAIAADLVEQ